jgi:hypothetical protein
MGPSFCPCPGSPVILPQAGVSALQFIPRTPATRQWLSPPEPGWAPTRSRPLWLRAEWARCIEPVTRNVWRTATLVMAVMLVAVFFAWTRSRLSSPEPPKYERITFRKGAISAARFAPDNQTVIYNAAWDKPTFKLYRSRVDATDARALDLPAAGLLAVSHSGELAITSNLNTSA